MKRPKRPKNKTAEESAADPAEKPVGVESLTKHFPALEPDKLEWLAEEMSAVRLKRGDRILVDSQSAADVFLVLKGAIAITWQHDSRHQVLVTLLAPGETFGVSSLLPEIAQGLKGYAFANSVVATIDSTRLVEILLGVELVAFKSAMEMTVGWSSKTLMRYIRMFHLSPRDQLVIALIEIGAKFGVRDSRGLILNLPVTQKDLADLLGSSRQSVNAHLAELVRLGAVINLSRQIVLVPGKLFALTGDPGVHYHAPAGKHFAGKPQDVAALSRREPLHL